MARIYIKQKHFPKIAYRFFPIIKNNHIVSSLILTDFNLSLYDEQNNNKPIITNIPAKYGDNILLLVENYIDKNNLEITFDELIPLTDEE
jgi:hypothetical protein